MHETARLEIRIPIELKNSLEKISLKTGTSQSEIIRGLLQIFIEINELKEERELKINVISKVLELIENMAKEIPRNSEEEIVCSNSRQDYPGQVPYYYAMICRDKCRYAMIQRDNEWGSDRKTLAIALLEDNAWNVSNVLSHIIYYIQNL